jgi:hypothetical protein
MQAAQTSASQPELRQPVHEHRGQSTSPSIVGPDVNDLSLPLPSDEEFLSRFGDTIDDRIAEILDELLAERSSARQHWQLPYLAAAVSLVLAAIGVSVLAWHTPIAWLIWPVTAAVLIACRASGSLGP